MEKELTNAMYMPLRSACARIMANDDGSLYNLAGAARLRPERIR